MRIVSMGRHYHGPTHIARVSGLGAVRVPEREQVGGGPERVPEIHLGLLQVAAGPDELDQDGALAGREAGELAVGPGTDEGEGLERVHCASPVCLDGGPEA